jgi:hypothetical protein
MLCRTAFKRNSSWQNKLLRKYVLLAKANRVNRNVYFVLEVLFILCKLIHDRTKRGQVQTFIFRITFIWNNICEYKTVLENRLEKKSFVFEKNRLFWKKSFEVRTIIHCVISVPDKKTFIVAFVLLFETIFYENDLLFRPLAFSFLPLVFLLAPTKIFAMFEEPFG